MSLLYEIFGIPRNLDKFLEGLENEHVVVGIEEKAKTSIFLPETAQYYERIVLSSGSKECRLPWKYASTYYGTMSGDGYLAMLKRQGELSIIAGAETQRQIQEIVQILEGKGLSYEVNQETKIVFGFRKYFPPSNCKA